MRDYMGDRVHHNKGRFYWEWILKAVLYTTCSATLMTSSYFIVKGLFFYYSSITKSSYPTSVPWINNKFQCEYSGRTWSRNNCWDEEQSPWF
ncbi:hypothetical protein [Nostoc sp. TCL26-01]|uniref:hypothetical protein n=1 Tax=Nostoc sp. TCL26-01 TaxID=2576904 RepID=UPI0015BA8C96|nr:hypothetical protein [Nostoc sp. TCL26-01]QLE54606.1 hypothetical protein FD725_03200 [Nostoc sp. TCL26-01]